MKTWHSDGSFVRKVVDCVVDVLTTKPFAAGQLFARIDFLINARPAFVATGTYLGPDRRKSDRDSDFPLFDVPNTLRECIEGGGYDPEDIGNRVAESFAKVKAQRTTMQEWNIGRFISATVSAIREGRPSEEVSEAVDSLITAAALFAEERQSAGPDREMAPAHVLVETLKAITAAGKDFSEEDCDRVRALIESMNIQIPADNDAVGGSGTRESTDQTVAP